MLSVLVKIFITFGPSAAIVIDSKTNAGILLPDEMIGGWHRPEVNHYTFERMQSIGHDHPTDRCLSMKLFWPEEYTRIGRITFFKCINRTPEAAKALMHILRGGIGTPELALEVVYTPFQDTFFSTMIITCDIYAETSGIEENEDNVQLDLFKVYTPNTLTTPAGVQTEKEIFTLDTTARESIPTVNVPSTISGTTIGPQATLKETEQKFEESEKERLFEGERNPEIFVTEFHTRTVSQRTDETVAYTESTSSKMNVKTTSAGLKISEESLGVDFTSSGDGEIRRMGFDENATKKPEKPIWQNQNIDATTGGMKLEKDSYEKFFHNATNSIMDDRTSFVSESTGETKDGTTDYFEVTTPKISTQTISLSRKTSLEITTIGLRSNKENLEKDRKDSKSGITSKVNQMHCGCLKTIETILDAQNTETSETNLQDSQSQSQSQSFTHLVTLENREDKNPNEKEGIEKPVTSPWYNLVVKSRPEVSRRKMGLAKITY